MIPANSSVVSVPLAAPSESVKRLLPWLLAVAPLSRKAVLSSYTLSLTVFIPISGWMADRFGTRRVFSSAIGLFTLGSFLCGISSNIHVLVACHILQGCGGASDAVATPKLIDICCIVLAMATAFFIPDRFHTSAPEMIHGIHQAFLVLGGLTVLSAVGFCELKNDGGDTVSLHNPVQHVGCDDTATRRHNVTRSESNRRPRILCPPRRGPVEVAVSLPGIIHSKNYLPQSGKNMM